MVNKFRNRFDNIVTPKICAYIYAYSNRNNVQFSYWVMIGQVCLLGSAFAKHRALMRSVWIALYFKDALVQVTPSSDIRIAATGAVRVILHVAGVRPNLDAYTAVALRRVLTPDIRVEHLWLLKFTHLTRHNALIDRPVQLALK